VGNIIGNGHNVYYDKSLATSLNGAACALSGGGKLMPKS
jgi:hypothetical protein